MSPEEHASKSSFTDSAHLYEQAPPTSRMTVRVIDRVVETAAALLLASIVGIMFWNATSRYLLDNPLGWAEEVVTGLLLWLTVLGMLIAARRNELIVIRAFTRRFNFRIQVVLKMVADLVSVLLLAHLAWTGLQYLLEFGADKSAYLRIPNGVFTSALPVGIAAVAVAMLLQLPHARRVVRRWFHEDGKAIGGRWPSRADIRHESSSDGGKS